MEMFHVFPINDTDEHELTSAWHPILQIEICYCKCQPELKGNVFVHNSFDGREGVEWANELLNAI